MKKIISIICITILVINFSYAQIDKEKALRPKVELKLADLLYAQSHYYSAAEYYKEVVRVQPDNRYAKYWLAMATLKAADYENALRYFKAFDQQAIDAKKKMKRVEKENKEVYGLANYYYGITLKHNGKYEEAIQVLNEFKAKYDDTDKEIYIKKANVEIKGAEWALANPGLKKVKVNTLGDLINTGYEDAAPLPVDDSTIYYTSLQEDDLVFVKNRNDIPNYRLYESKKVNGVWQKGKKLASNFQDEKFGTANAALSEDGNRMYFCKCHHNEIDEIICNLYLSEKNKNGRWQEAVALNNQINDPKYTSTHPTVRTSGDGMEIVYFVSDRDGGKGGMDIWYFIRTARGDFKGPRLLGGGVNTINDELTPYYDNLSETLYFSSNGHPTVGGFDVFSTKESDDLGWETPKNLGFPINSSADDLFYTKEKDKTSGFLVSNREGTSKIKGRYRGDDIFYFEDFKYGLNGFVFKEDEEGQASLEGAKVRLYATDSLGNDVLIEELDNVTEQYFFNLKPDNDYKVEVVKTGYSSSYEYISTRDIPYEDTLSQNLLVDKTSVIVSGSLYDDADSLKSKKLDDAILILSWMDNGVKRPLSTKKLPYGSTDFNFNLDVNKEYVIEVTKDGYFRNSATVNTANLKSAEKGIHQDILLSKIEVGKSYELANILYDFGKATLRDESKAVLDDLLLILQENPTIIIELGSHTDAVGSDASNFKLSQARAQSCVDYLISKGISKDRLSAKGYGESMPIAPNENEDGSDNEEGRQKNRRTEFKVLESF